VSSLAAPNCTLAAWGSMATSCLCSHCVLQLPASKGTPHTHPARICTRLRLILSTVDILLRSVETGGRPTRWEDNASARIMTRFDSTAYSRGSQAELCLVWSVSRIRGRYPYLPAPSLISNYAIACFLRYCLFTKQSFLVPSSSL